MSNGIFTLCLILASASNALVRQASVDAIDKEYRISRGTPAAKKVAIEAQIRIFLWAHFNQHRGGSLKVTWFTLEGEPSIYLYKIGTHAEALWSIDVNLEKHSHLRSRAASPKEDIIRQNYTALAVKIVTPSDQNAENTPSVPSLKFFEDHKIQLVDRQGNVVQEI